MSGASPHSPGLRWRWVLAVALGYWLAGRLALLMAIPPGYATAVWPAAGLALTAAMVWGPRACAGVALGSCLVNLGWPFQPAPSLASAAIAVCLGLGAGLQAALGAFLVRRSIGARPSLDEAGAISRFLLWGGPAGCVVAASWGVTTLAVAGVIPWPEFAFSWMTWWVGDCIGVLVFAPLLLAFVGQPRELWRRRRWPLGGALALGFAVVTAVFVLVSRWELDRARASFRQRTLAITQTLQRFASLPVYEVEAVVSLYDSSREVERTEFRAFARRALARRSGLTALEFVPRVPASERAAREQEARRDGLPGFALWELQGDGQGVPAALRDVHFPVFYVEPALGHEHDLGFDLASLPERTRVLLAAAASGRTITTGPVTPWHLPAPARGVLVVSPIYAHGGDAGTPGAGLGNLLGFAIGVVSVDALVDSALEHLDRTEVALSIVDQDSGQLLYGVGWRDCPGCWRATLEFAGRSWMVGFAPAGRPVAQRGWQAWLVLVAGLLFVSLLGAGVLLVTGRTVELERHVRERTAELRQREDDLSASVHTVEASLHEKEALLKEVHHRVKNNLQVISSLLRTQAQRSALPEVRDALEDSCDRVASIALVHEHLYRSDDLTAIDFDGYVRTLLAHMVAAHGEPAGPVHIESTLEGVALDVERAIPCGLIISELVTNALKHAFPNGRGGSIRITLRRSGAKAAVLVVADDGVGLPVGAEAGGGASLGLTLVRALVAQIGGQLVVDRTAGTAFHLSFEVAAEPAHRAAGAERDAV